MIWLVPTENAGVLIKTSLVITLSVPSWVLMHRCAPEKSTIFDSKQWKNSRITRHVLWRQFRWGSTPFGLTLKRANYVLSPTPLVFWQVMPTWHSR